MTSMLLTPCSDSSFPIANKVNSEQRPLHGLVWKAQLSQSVEINQAIEALSLGNLNNGKRIQSGKTNGIQ